MGFHVGLDSESDRLIELVTTDPSKVLGKLYSAYMLFLVGEPDEAELKWLLKNAKALDSLTGDYIAYAVFAEKFKVTLRASSWNLVKRPPCNVGEVSLEDIPKRSSVTRLVKGGAFGMIVDGDELTAITYGTDRVARALGILDKLPFPDRNSIATAHSSEKRSFVARYYSVKYICDCVGRGRLFCCHESLPFACALVPITFRPFRSLKSERFSVACQRNLSSRILATFGHTVK